MKLWATLRNGSSTMVHVYAPTWEPQTGGVRAQLPHAAKILREADNGWDPEKNDVQALPRKRVRIWIGLDPTLSVSDFQERHDIRQLGTLVFQLEQDGKNIVQKITV